MNLKQEFKSILKKYGHNVYIQRRTDAGGAGPYRKALDKYETTIEKWTAYRRPLGSSTDFFMKLDDEGLVTNFDMLFYFQPDCQIKTADRVIEDTPEQITDRQVFIVKKAIPYYFGRDLIYIAAYCDKLLPTER